jgi:hypothetical protein
MKWGGNGQGVRGAGMGDGKVTGARGDDGRADSGTDLSELIVLPPPVLAHSTSLLIARYISIKLGLCQGIFGVFFNLPLRRRAGIWVWAASGGVWGDWRGSSRLEE